jgi:filamentous hemagglutinin
MGTSQLGGAVYGNPNLNQNADIILNEVGTTNRSVLNGALEVFGRFILALKNSIELVC